MLKHFTVNPQRHLLIPDVQCFQADLSSIVELARKEDPALFVEDGIYLPSFTKLVANPIKAKGFWKHMLEAMFYGVGGCDELNMQLQMPTTYNQYKTRVVMVFLPGSTKVDNLQLMAEQAREILPGYDVFGINGETTSNLKAEAEVNGWVKEAKRNKRHLLLLSSGMASRSFSIGEITEVYLAFDGGENGATIQKMSRALTPHNDNKVGNIISLSFDPNRDDKFDAMVLTSAVNYKAQHKLPTLKVALQVVLQTFDIFSCTKDGSLKILLDNYLPKLIERDSLTRVLGKTADLTRLDEDDITAMLNGDVDYFKNEKVQTTDKGKTAKNTKITQQATPMDHDAAKEHERDLAKIKQMITTIVENVDVLLFGTGTSTIEAAFNSIRISDKHQTAVLKHFGIDYRIIEKLFERKVLNCDLIHLLISK